MARSTIQSRLLSGRLLARNVLWNFGGGALPLLAAAISIPILTRRLGVDRFGILTLAWVLVSYFGLFDLGLGWGLIKLVSERLGAGREREIPGIVWTALALMTALGCAGAAVIAWLSPWLVLHVLKVPAALRTETLRSFLLLACAIPILIGTTGLRGYLEARQAFHISNAIRIPVSTFNFLGPLLVLPFSVNLAAIVGLLVAARLAAWLAYLIACLRLDPSLRRKPRLDRAMVRPLARFGAWLTVSNIVGPLMTYWDRFLVGAIVSLTAVAYYATPYEAVSRLWIVPAAIGGVLFPAFSTSYACDQARMRKLFGRGVRTTFLALFPLALLLVVFAPEILRVWLGAEFARESTRVWQILVAGIFVNSIAQIPFALLQGMDRPDITAKLHVIELALYLPAVWWATRSYGIDGTAAVWSLRVSLDGLLLFACVGKMVPEIRRVAAHAAVFAAGALALFLMGAMQTGLVFRGALSAATLLGFVFAGWFWVLTRDERTLLSACLKPARIAART